MSTTKERIRESALEGYTYDHQLKYLNVLIQGLGPSLGAPRGIAIQKRMLLSLAESVKEAREHNLNCRREG